MTPNQKAVLRRIYADLLKARMRLPWITPDLQTLRNTLRKPSVDLDDWTVRDLRLGFHDGDETQCYVHQPSRYDRQQRGHVLLIHGLGGDANGAAIRYLTHSLLTAGFRVARINLRAAPMVYHLASGISHAGKTEDLRDILRGLDAALGPQQWFPLGISLGGNMLAKALGDGALDAFDIGAAMTICAPLDMQAASDRILARRNVIYERYLLRDLKAAVSRTGMSSAWKNAAINAQNVFDFDDKVTGPYHGFGDARTYYSQASAGPYLERIKVPTLLLTAQDDPWIPAESYHPFETPRDAPAQMLFTRYGGHVGFHFKDAQAPAYCDAAVQWFMAATN